MLAEIREAGFEGVELMQDPKVLGDPQVLFQLLHEHQLALVGIAGGSLEERVDYVHRMRKLAESDAASIKIGWGLQVYRNPLPLVYPYVYVDDWSNERHLALLERSEVVLALHPHMFKPVQTADEADRVLKAHPQLRFLPDTAHLAVAGENPVGVIARNLPRLAAVHLKDWTAEFGRSYQYYSKGFAKLGEGDVPVREVVQMLLSEKYLGWLLVEQDTTGNPATSAQLSREWLRREAGV